MPRSSKSKVGSSKRKRREELRRNLPRRTISLRTFFERPEVLNAALLLLAFVALSTLVVTWSREQVKVAVGQVMTSTRVNRLDFTVVDQTETAERREEERSRAPAVYTLDPDALDLLRTPLLNLPVLVAQQPDFEAISEEVRDAYALEVSSLDDLGGYATDGTSPSAAWTSLVDRLLSEVLVRYPIVDSDAWQSGMLEPVLPLILDDDDQVVTSWHDAIPITGNDANARADLRRDLTPVVHRAGFPLGVARHVAAGLASQVRPTYVKNEARTLALQDERASKVETVRVENKTGEIIYRRGDVLGESQRAALVLESAFYRADAPAAERWRWSLGVLGLVALVAVFIGVFFAVAYPRVIRHPLRLLAVLALMLGMLALSVALTAQEPKYLLPAAVAPALFVTITLLLAYDQRLAMVLGAVQCGLLAVALQQDTAWALLLTAGCATMVVQLREVRHRNSLIRAALVTAAVLGVGTMFYGIYRLPSTPGAWLQVLNQSAWALAASTVTGFLMLGLLPSIERVFDITTGMTLAELRDTNQELLRQLQQRAPGTYNHSLQVATIAEGGADAIGADSLLVYVGALYHDIGKMNKPEYFVENQTDGFNKHSKLRPAMSLLVIIGHVKDGIELAREYGLPRTLQHFIASHHGTTLVEYFYHAAKSQAESDDKTSPEEVEFRYPGPRPRTREAAILMLADAVESATRAMTEPNPSRIESVVRELSRKRLLDGQFNECDLTFRELAQIEDSMIGRLCAIHHGRISYPTSRPEEAAEPEPAVRMRGA